MSTIFEPGRSLEVRYGCDVAVCGGGFGGVAAAAAAARSGKKVILLEKQFMLGGLGTAGIVTIYLPICDGRGRQVSFGLAEELLRVSIEHGCEKEYPSEWFDKLPDDASDEEKEARLRARINHRYRLRYSAPLCAISLEGLLLREGVTILYGSAVCGVHEEGGRITHIMVEGKGERFAISAGAVVDATGDADVCGFSSAPVEYFKQGNVLAGWYYLLADGKVDLRMVGGAADVPAGFKPASGGSSSSSNPRLPNLPEGRFLGLDTGELSDVTIRSHAATLAHFLAGGKLSDTHALTMMTSTPQVRMTRRIAGEYTLDIAEEHKYFEDSVGLFPNWRKAGPVYELPFGTLWSRRVGNLLTAGRCISVTDPMWDISRVIPVCSVTGEAAGCAAAMVCDGGHLAEVDVSALQSELVSRGVLLHE